MLVHFLVFFTSNISGDHLKSGIHYMRHMGGGCGEMSVSDPTE